MANGFFRPGEWLRDTLGNLESHLNRALDSPRDESSRPPPTSASNSRLNPGSSSQTNLPLIRQQQQKQGNGHLRQYSGSATTLFQAPSSVHLPRAAENAAFNQQDKNLPPSTQIDPCLVPLPPDNSEETTELARSVARYVQSTLLHQSTLDNKELQQTKLEAKRLRDEIRDRDAQVAGLKAAVATLREKLSKKESNDAKVYEKNTEVMQKSIEDANAAKVVAESRADAAEAQLRSLQAKLDVSELQVQATEKACKEAQRVAEQVHAEIAKRLEERDAAHAADMQRVVRETTQRSASTLSSLHETRRKLDACDAELQRVQKELEVYKSRATEAESMLAKAEQEGSDAASLSRKLSAQVVELDDKIQNYEARILELENTISDLQNKQNIDTIEFKATQARLQTEIEHLSFEATLLKQSNVSSTSMQDNGSSDAGLDHSGSVGQKNDLSCQPSLLEPDSLLWKSKNSIIGSGGIFSQSDLSQPRDSMSLALRAQIEVLNTSIENLSLQLTCLAREKSTAEQNTTELQNQHAELQCRHNAALDALKKREIELSDLRNSAEEARTAYRKQLEELLSKTTR